ncbi:MAG: 3'-phosphoesterase [Solirubrobacterales bacterium]|nr:3'-phosphoesterase [Solirubrobacterales bacterium]
MGSARRYVIQQHSASTEHYDLRLQTGDVLRSWAVPKGPSLNPADRRLAQPVPDHSLGHGDFEGVLPDARRGTGAVIIWDEGTYDLHPTARDGAKTLADALERGHAAIELHGHKLRGGWALTRVAVPPAERWILVKMRDAEADPACDITASRPESVRSGRTLGELSP